MLSWREADSLLRSRNIALVSVPGIHGAWSVSATNFRLPSAAPSLYRRTRPDPVNNRPKFRRAPDKLAVPVSLSRERHTRTTLTCHYTRLFCFFSTEPTGGQLVESDPPQIQYARQSPNTADGHEVGVPEIHVGTPPSLVGVRFLLGLEHRSRARVRDCSDAFCAQ